MSPPVSSNGKRGSSRPAAAAAAAPSKKSVSRSSGSGHNGGTGGGGGGAGHKRSASAAAIEDEHQAAAAASKRTKRNASAKKSLREEELGVGAELAEDDMIEAGDEATLDEEGDEGDGGVTRCVCGEDNEEMASGLMIQCDTCKCWQHGPCVGLWDEKECPNRYFCELCKPNLHGPGGLLRKATRKTSAAPAPRAVTPPPPPTPVVTSHKGHRPRESADASVIAAYLSADGGHSPEQKPSAGGPAVAGPHKEPKKRSTMNSRDAAYDDAIALSILEAGTAAMRAKLEKTHESEGEQSDVEEIVISGAGGRGKGKKTAAGPKTAKGGRGSSANARGGKSKTTRGRREHSNVDDEGEDESPRPASTPAEGAMKEEVLDAADPALDDPRDAGPPSSRPSDERGRNGGAGESDDQNTRRDVTAAAGRPTIERSPSPAPSAPLQSAPQPTGARTKHPNQYTYRGKNGQGTSTRGGKSPSKRGGAASATLGSHVNGQEAAALKPLSDAAAQAVAGWGMPDHLRHLAHLLPAPAPSPLSIVSLADPSEPPSIEAPTKVRFPGKRVTMPEMRKRARAVLEFVTRVQLEMSERDRRWELLRDVNGQVKEAREKVAREKATRATAGSTSASASGSGSGSGSRSAGGSEQQSRASSMNPRGVGGTTPVPGGSTSADLSSRRRGDDDNTHVDGPAPDSLPPLPTASTSEQDPLALSSSASPACVALMDALSKEVMAFQQKFFGHVD